MFYAFLGAGSVCAFLFFLFFCFVICEWPAVIPFVVAVWNFCALVLLFVRRSPTHKCIANLSEMFNTCIVRALYSFADDNGMGIG